MNPFNTIYTTILLVYMDHKIKFDYLELRNEKDLSIFKKKKKFRLFVAYHIGKVRLIDNF